jgi:hypothetical protein
MGPRLTVFKRPWRLRIFQEKRQEQWEIYPQHCPGHTKQTGASSLEAGESQNILSVTALILLPDWELK